jgi:hypothetical protein
MEAAITRRCVSSKDALLTVQIGRNARGEKTARCHGERAAEIDHAGKGAAVEDVEAVLLRVSEVISSGSASDGPD